MNTKTEVVPVEETKPVIVDQSTAMISVIERVALDPNADIDKLERMLAMQERIINKQAETSFNIAMSEAQSEIKPIIANKKGQNNMYATYAKVDDAIRPIYTEHGFNLSFNTGATESQEEVNVLCYVSHNDGFSRTYNVIMPADGKGPQGNSVMSKTHATGSAMSYGMRYLLGLIFNLAIIKDDDGIAASKTLDIISEDMALTAEASIEENNIDIKKVKGWMKTKFGTDDIARLDVGQYPHLVHKIKETIKYQKKAEK